MIIEFDQAGATQGRISHVSTIHRPELAAHLQELGRSFIEIEGAAVSHIRNYVADGKLAERPVAPIALSKDAIKADGQDVAVLSGVPAGWDLAIDGAAPVKADGSDIEITSTLPHAYKIKASGPWPMLDWRGTVTAG